MANIQEVASRLIELCRKGDFATATSELYDDSIISIEPSGAMGPERIEGMEAKKQKDAYWEEGVEEFHSNEVSEPIIGGHHFSVRMNVDVTFKGQGRTQMDEICVYRVNNDGKIDLEQFFYPTEQKG